MGNPYAADFADDTGQVRLGGEITFTDQANQPGGGSNPNVGVVVEYHGTGPAQTIPNANANWDQLDLSTLGAFVDPAPAWATLDGTDLVIAPSAGILVVTNCWIGWETSAVGAVRGLLVAHAGGGTLEFLDDAATMLTPAQYTALAAFEGSMGNQVINRVDPDDGLRIQPFVYQDSGGDLDVQEIIMFVTPIA